MKKITKEYLQIEFWAGIKIETALEQLKEQSQLGDLCCGLFNDVMLYSDIDTIDTAYLRITGKTKNEHDLFIKSEAEKLRQSEKQHLLDIAELTKKWIDTGNKILDAKYHEDWAKIVPIRLSDLYKGMELEACLEIIEKLNNGCELSEAKEIIDGQGHSGMSYGLVKALVVRFCDRGIEFAEQLKIN